MPPLPDFKPLSITFREVMFVIGMVTFIGLLFSAIYVGCRHNDMKPSVTVVDAGTTEEDYEDPDEHWMRVVRRVHDAEADVNCYIIPATNNTAPAIDCIKVWRALDEALEENQHEEDP